MRCSERPLQRPFERRGKEARSDQEIDRLDDEIALTALDAYDAKVEELDIQAALNCATNALRNASKFWLQCSSDQSRTFSECFFLKD